MNPVSLQRNDAKAPMYQQQPGGYPAGGPPQMGGMPNQQMGMQQPMGSMPGQQMGGIPPQQMGMQQGQYGQPMGSMPGQQMGGMPNQQYGQPQMGGMPNQQMGLNQPMGSMPGQQMGGMPGQQMGMQQGQYGQPGMQQQVGMNPPLGRVSLVKGQNMSLTKAAPNLRHARIGLGWDVRQTGGPAFDLDASVFLLNGQNMVGQPNNFIFYNNKQSMDGSIMHHGDNLTGAGEGDDEQISIDLTRVSPDIQRVVFVVSIYEAEQRQQNFGMVQRAFIRVVDQDTQQEIVRFDLTEEACMWNCMMFGELYRYGNEWKFKALGNGLQGGLRAAGAQFGMQLS